MASDGTPITFSVQSAQTAQASVATAKPADGTHFPSSAAASAVTATSAAAAAQAAAATKTAEKAAGSTSVFAHATEGAAPVEKPTPPATQRDLGTLVSQLNKQLNDSGRPDQFRVDPQSGMIQEVNPANGAVIGQFAASEFPALARSAGASATGLLVDSLA